MPFTSRINYSFCVNHVKNFFKYVNNNCSSGGMLCVCTQFRIHKHFRRINYSFSNYCFELIFFLNLKSNQQNVYPNYLFWCSRFRNKISWICPLFIVNWIAYGSNLFSSDMFCYDFNCICIRWLGFFLKVLLPKFQICASNIAFVAWIWRYVVLALNVLKLNVSI